MSDYILGRNPVMEALKSGRQVHRVLVAKGSGKGSVVEIISRARDARIPIQEVERNALDKMTGGQNHQGVVALVPAMEYVEVADILDTARKKGEPPFVLVLDEIEDPHNLGAILRTADAAGVHGVIIPKRRAVGLTGTVSKASAGAVEYVPVARVVNLARTLETLKKEGLWIVGADVDGEVIWQSKGLSGPLACVIGGEGRGISRLIKEKCDYIVSIPMRGQINSLNASVAAAVLCYEILRQKEKVNT
ncbi:23S rRNA (guanosine(2251)-2'-O)-methyltransferase RlmB [Phosphitispora fastidiosa]|uniref:23S rRNA (guanosine(2251)-2'-O)-methyltransferase RlmB n=1 Tax=Phosphitispora fastidiosa TaxID=2837202 RepID=UPI001E3F8361|nr:23S rRNA (guanosine(2251)-2'-O)-methyltransferase RlmB [Phosphitispora fastidiosa]MBU7007483.1 23S rRNA (guanosine2251-2'-O)-methyltransferase [Phosphitispora fastidiosa]